MLELLSLLILGSAMVVDGAQESEPLPGPKLLPPPGADLQKRTRAAWEGAGMTVLPWNDYQASTLMLLGQFICPEGHAEPWAGIVKVPNEGPGFSPEAEWSTGYHRTFNIAYMGVCLHEDHVGPKHFEVPIALQDQLVARRDTSGPRMIFLVVWSRPDIESNKDQIETIGDVRELMDRARKINSNETEDASESDPALLEWALKARPGDVIDGWWNIAWIVAMLPDAKNAEGDQAQILIDWPYTP